MKKVFSFKNFIFLLLFGAVTIILHFISTRTSVLHQIQAAQSTKSFKKSEIVADLNAIAEDDKLIKNEEIVEYPFEDEGEETGNKGDGKGSCAITEIQCDINHGSEFIACKKDTKGDVFIPFTFIHKYFEITGKMKGPTLFEWIHVEGKIIEPTGPYDPLGPFMYFANYNVEGRERVKCVAGSGVPVSTQWDIRGFYYPVQISQFGLSHYSKWKVEGDSVRKILEDGDTIVGTWERVKGFGELSRKQTSKDSHDIALYVPPNTSWRLTLSKKSSLVLRFLWKTDGNGSLALTLKHDSETFNVHYNSQDFLIKTIQEDIWYGLGESNEWREVVRDLAVDVQKGRKGRKIARSKLIPLYVQIEGPCWIDELSLANQEHRAQFLQAADWLERNQGKNGGWPIPVKRKFGAEFPPTLEPGWQSAMGVGHGISLLTRAFALTGEEKYGTGVGNALGLFRKDGGDGGVRAEVRGLPWYEEYPTSPPTLVLNGFIYSLLGLYDASKSSLNEAGEAAQLFEEGFESLKNLLPLYDTGSGSLYDLRHWGYPGIPPNLARADYHVTHINQLLTLATLPSEGSNSFLHTVAKRWIAYMDGKRAAHN